MAGGEKERDWDKEMAEVDRLLRKLPYVDPQSGASTQPTVKLPGSAAAVSRGGVTPSGVRAGATGGRLGTWLKVGLGVLLGVGVAPGVWPYPHGCGLRLILYLIGVGAVIAVGLWASVSSWKRRLGVAHVIAQALIVWGVFLATREVLPHVGPTPAAPWLCP